MKIKAIKNSHEKWERIEFPSFKKGTVIEFDIVEDEDFGSWHSAVIEGRETFVPISFVDGNKLNRDYNPTELAVKAGDILEVLEIVNAWLVVKDASDTIGWVPADHVVSIGGTK